MLSNYMMDKRITELQKMYDAVYASKGKKALKNYGLPMNPEYEDLISMAESETYNEVINNFITLIN